MELLIFLTILDARFTFCMHYCFDLKYIFFYTLFCGKISIFYDCNNLNDYQESVMFNDCSFKVTITGNRKII